jgi:ferrous iron transport protein A
VVTTDLSKLAVGSSARVAAVGASGPLKRRLMDMGLVPGEVVKVVKVAPLGDPIEISVKSYCLSLRRKEAEGIAVEVAP